MKKIIKRENGTTRVIHVNDQPSLTQPQFQDQCNINNIMKQYKNTGQITHTHNKRGFYADLSNMPSYQEALGQVIQANDAFMSLPADIRKRFSNDPGQLIEFLSDPNNLDEARKLGLANPPPPETHSDPPQTPITTTNKTKKTKNPKQTDLDLDGDQ